MKVRLTPNVKKSTIPKIGYIIHGTLGSYQGAIEWLCTKPEKRPTLSYSSAHYVISKKGEITKLADEKDVTWHAGIVRNPTYRARLHLPRGGIIPAPLPTTSYKNPNDYFVGIECEWFIGDVLTEEQLVAIASIVKNGGIKNPILLSHSEMTDYKEDFGRDEKGMWNIQEVIRRCK